IPGRRIDRNYILEEAQSLLNLEKGYLYTVKSLFVFPGRSIREYIKGDREQLTRPLIYLFFNSFLAVFLSGYLNNPAVNSDAIEFVYLFDENIKIDEIIRWKKTHMGYVYLCFGLFMTFWIHLFYKKYEFNIYEIFVALAFILGQGMLLYILALTMNHFLPQGTFKIVVVTVLGLSYYIYILVVLVQLFRKKKLFNFFKLVFIFAISGISFLSVQILALLGFNYLGWL
ncbi:MAG: DUF3667 domain-containing protein, partial [Gramella sp.]|nr:DUF3667 domain-containing protein [Christiangramia sp.]